MATSRLCSIPNCGKPRFCREWCSGHYHRWQRHGDPLGGGTPNGEPMRFFCEVVLPYDGLECLLWPYMRTGSGYAIVTIDGRADSATRVVCERAHGPAPTPDHEAAHSCGHGDRGCVTKRHLRWATPKENGADKILHGTSTRGSRNASAKLIDDDIREIRAMKGTMFQHEIANRFGVTAQLIGMIHSRKSWGWLE